MKQIKQFLLLATLFVSGVMWGGTNVCTVYDNNGTELISYENLGDAFNFAVNNPNLTMHIVMTADYTLPAGDYTLPANASLLIPHKADQKKPYGEDPWRISELETPAVFRTLTFADGVNIVVKGMLEISSQQYVASASTNGTGRVAGAYGQLNVADGCNVWLDKGSKLCAWGYMFGNGNVQAKRGATVYEMFQVYDWKGGTNVTTHFLDNHHGVFPFNQYFIQNIEMPVTYQPGSQLLTSFGITASGAIYAVNNIGIIGTRGNKIKSMFEMDDDADEAGVWVRKSYNPTDDRQVYEINNAAYLNAMTITAMGFTFSSDAYQLPITNNMDIHLLAGFMDITQDVTMLPGAQIEVDKESIVRVLSNKSVYLYDLDQWGKYAYSNAYAKKVWYSPSWTDGKCPRDKDNSGTIDSLELTDASINIHGTLELHGNIFTTTKDDKSDGGANIFSTNADAGTIQFADDYTTPADSAVYQWKQTTFPEGKFYGAKAPSAWLKNQTGYVKTGDLAAPAGKSLCYINDAWTNMTTVECFVYDEANNKWYIKPAEYVQIYVEGTEPKEDEHTHLYTDVDKTRLFLLEEANCQWWEVTYQSDKDAYYCATNGRYYRYNEDEWQEAKVVVTFDPANGQSPVNYNVKLGAVPQYVGDDPVKAQDQTGSYTFQGWSSDGGATIYKFNPMPQVWAPITYTAQYNKIEYQKIVITFADVNNGADAHKVYNKGEMPSYDETPVKADDVYGKNYTFTGWEPTIVSATTPAIYTAQYTFTPVYYTITWLNEDGTTYKTDVNLTYGTEINLPENPTKPGYIFSGWRNEATGEIKVPEIIGRGRVVENVTYKAVFVSESGYHIIFKNENGYLYDEKYVEPNDEYTYDGVTPTKEGHNFIGWSPAFYPRTKATGDATYVAQFRVLDENVAEVTVNGVTTQYTDFDDAYNSVCDATGDVTIKMLNSTEYKVQPLAKVQPNTNLTFNLNGCELNLTGGAPFLTLSGSNKVTICDNSAFHGGKVIEDNLFITFIDEYVATPSQITMESGAIINTYSNAISHPIFSMKGDNSTFTMNGGYVEMSGSSSYPIFDIVGSKQSVEFNGGKWYFNNTGTGETSAFRCGSSCTYFEFNMNGGEIELIGKKATQVYKTASTPFHIEINGGKLSVSSTGDNATMFYYSATALNYNNTLNITNGEFSAKTTYSSGKARMTYNTFTGEISGGKFKVSAPQNANQYYFYNVPTNSIKGGLYNINDQKLSNGLSGGFLLKELRSTDSGYAEGYRYQVIQGKTVTWKAGTTTLKTEGVAVGELLTRYNRKEGETTIWYKDEACTDGQEWNFETETMPNQDLTLYCRLEEDVQVTIDGQSQLATFNDAFGLLEDGKECTITLIKKVTASSSKTVDKSFTLDLNGHTLTSDVATLFSVNANKTLTLTDNSAEHKGKIVSTKSTNTAPLIVLSGNLVINEGSYDISLASTSVACFCKMNDGCDITMNGGTINSSNTKANAFAFFFGAINETYTFNMTGGTIVVNASATGMVFNAMNSTLNATISGGILRCECVNSAPQQLANMFTIRSTATINISGGEFSYKATSGYSRIFSTTFTGSISGGKFKVEGPVKNKPSIFNSGDKYTSVTVTGGYYNVEDAKVKGCVPDSYEWIETTDKDYPYQVKTAPKEELTISEDVTLTDDTEVSNTLTITKTGKLTIPAGKTLTTNDFVIEATTTESGELINTGTVTVNGNAYFDLTFNAQAWTGSEWYSFAVPFEVDATSGISYEGAPLILGTDIDILYYDGATRAAKGANKSAWKYVENLGDKTLVPGKLYMAAFREDRPNAVRFTKKSDADLIFGGALNLNQYSASAAEDAGWNAIANPTLHHATLTATDITEGQVYVNGEDCYVVVTLASDELVVGRPIMIQTDANKSVVINTPAASAPVRKLMTNTSSNYSVALSQDGKLTDRVIVAIDDYAIDEYTIGQDLAKAGVSTKVAQMWVDRYDAQLCKNTVAADNNMAEYPLTISAPKAGEYTIALEQIPTDGVLLLTENGSITWNLNIAPATLDLSKGTDTTYGLRLVRKSGDVVTGNNEVILNGDVQKVIINDRLYIIRDGKVYSAHGHVIK